MSYAYSGAQVRAAHYARRPAPQGLAKDHFTGAVEDDIFRPEVDTPSAQTGTVWTGAEEFAPVSNMPNLAQVPVSHWYGSGDSPVPTNVPYGVAQQEWQNRFIADHANVNYVADSIRLYQHESEGMLAEWNVGRMPQNAGEDPGENLQYLVNGTNSYDHTNIPNEVYQGDEANVGRYRLGMKTNVYGLYNNPIGKFGQDALAHAYTGLNAAFPNTKPHMADTSPYTPNSTGTAHWSPAASNQVPSNFALPSETAMTDYATVSNSGYASDFTEDGRL